MAIGNHFVKFAFVRSGFDPDRRHFKSVRTEFPQALNKIPSLLAGARHGDAFSKEGLRLKPVEFLSERDNIAEYSHSGSLECGGFGFGCDIPHGAGQGLLTAGCGPANERNWGGCIHAGVDHPLRYDREALDAHEHDFCARSGGDGFVVEGGLGLSGIFVSGEDREHGIMSPVGDRDTSIGGASNRRGHPRDDLEATPSLHKSLRFLPAASKKKGIAALESCHRFS